MDFLPSRQQAECVLWSLLTERFTRDSLSAPVAAAAQT